MNKNQLEGNWEEMKGKIKKQWGKLTDDDIATFKGQEQEFSGRLQKAYGKTEEEANKEIDSFKKNCGCASDKAA